MELKTARLTLLIDPNKKAAFERLCARQDLTASQVVRRLIRDYLAEYGADYVASGVEEHRKGPSEGRQPAPTPQKTKSPTHTAPAQTTRAGFRRR
jgi:hypothetical protein